VTATPQLVGDFNHVWGESLRWDDRRQRLYFVDCGTHQLHWLDHGAPPLQSMKLPSLPTGVVLTEDGSLVVALDEGLYVLDPDSEAIGLLAAYPAGIGGRANDATADLDGNIVTGTLNAPGADGSYWWFSAAAGWRRLANGIGNANGPAMLDTDGTSVLVFADTTAATIYAFDYDGPAGTATNRRVFADTSEAGGVPDGACVDRDGGVWSCLLKAGVLARYTFDGLTDRIDATVDLPSDVTFGGSELDRLFFVSISVTLESYEPITDGRAGQLMVIDDLGYRGLPERRARL
jgi:L-arabinonolactonase